MQRKSVLVVAYLLTSVAFFSATAQERSGRPGHAASRQEQMNRDLIEVTIPQLERLYATRKYTVSEVVQWHLARIQKFNGIYRAVQNVETAAALQTARRLDAEARAGGKAFHRGPMWGVPIVIKANTSIEGLITTDGWTGYKIPGHELIAPRDATVVAKFKAAGAVILGQTNMPDFAASDTNRSSAFGRTGNAYDVRFSPGGSSGGTVTAVTSNYAVVGTGTDTGNSIRMPSSTSSVVGVFPTRGLVSMAGIAPLDWLLDNTGPIARDVTDAAIALGVMAGPDSLDPRTTHSRPRVTDAAYTQYLKKDALKGKRFGVPAFILKGTGVPFEGVGANLSAEDLKKLEVAEATPLTPETHAAFMKAIDGLRAAGAEVVFDESILPDSFADVAARIFTAPYVREGTETFLKNFGPAQYHSAEEYAKAVGSALPSVVLGRMEVDGQAKHPVEQRSISGASARADFYDPLERALAAYAEPIARLHLDGYVYPAAQMPPPDETMPQDGRLGSGPHSDTSWVNMIGVPAIVVPGGFYASGLPFGLEISGRLWRDGELLGYAYAYEQATKHRKPPVLVEKGLLPEAR